jgi:hypothetical protein
MNNKLRVKAGGINYLMSIRVQGLTNSTYAARKNKIHFGHVGSYE